MERACARSGGLPRGQVSLFTTYAGILPANRERIRNQTANPPGPRARRVGFISSSSGRARHAAGTLRTGARVGPAAESDSRI